MGNIKTLCVTGYKSFEIGVFQDNDPKITVIKNVLKKAIMGFLDTGLEWVLISGNLGTESWAAEVVAELKNDYPELKLGIVYPFKKFGSNWNEKNRTNLKKIEGLADYVDSVSHQPYKSPAQLKMHTRFLLEHSGASLFVYDKEYPGKSKYFLKDAELFSEKFPYEIHLITMDELQNSVD